MTTLCIILLVLALFPALDAVLFGCALGLYALLVGFWRVWLVLGATVACFWLVAVALFG